MRKENGVKMRREEGAQVSAVNNTEGHHRGSSRNPG